jgi:hypothetical protein
LRIRVGTPELVPRNVICKAQLSKFAFCNYSDTTAGDPSSASNNAKRTEWIAFSLANLNKVPHTPHLSRIMGFHRHSQQIWPDTYMLMQLSLLTPRKSEL